MADEVTPNGEGTGLNRRNFLKSAGVVVAGGTLGAAGLKKQWLQNQCPQRSPISAARSTARLQHL
jgi:hypothetical protein